MLLQKKLMIKNLASKKNHLKIMHIKCFPNIDKKSCILKISFFFTTYLSMNISVYVYRDTDSYCFWNREMEKLLLKREILNTTKPPIVTVQCCASYLMSSSNDSLISKNRKHKKTEKTEKYKIYIRNIEFLNIFFYLVFE